MFLEGANTRHFDRFVIASSAYKGFMLADFVELSLLD
jgi:hypothetical protein